LKHLSLLTFVKLLILFVFLFIDRHIRM
jgi:hypothetical protein